MYRHWRDSCTNIERHTHMSFELEGCEKNNPFKFLVKTLIRQNINSYTVEVKRLLTVSLDFYFSNFSIFYKKIQQLSFCNFLCSKA